MPTLTRPGVYVDESRFPTFAATSPGTATAAFVGKNPRGPVANVTNQQTQQPTPSLIGPNTGPVLISSWREYTSYFGGFDVAFPPSPLALAIYTYFLAGGTTAVVLRAVSTADPPTLASTPFLDRAATPQPTVKLSAVNPGAWGSMIYIDILDGTIVDHPGGTAQTFTVQVKYQGSDVQHIVERWENLSMIRGSTVLGQNNYVVDVINSTYTGSKYIYAEVITQTAPDAPPTNNPAVTSAPVQLQGGTDGSQVNPDGSVGASPNFNDIQAAIQALDQFPDQGFVLNMCGAYDSNDIGNAIAYAQGRGDVFVVLDCPPGHDPNSMVQTANGIAATPAAAIYYPQVKIGDPYSPTLGQTRLVPPGGFIAGLFMQTDLRRSVAKAPAGLAASLPGAAGLEYVLTNSDLGMLTQANVNCIISQPGSGIVVWGARTLSPYLVTRYVNVQRTLIYLQTNLVRMTKFAVFEPNDWILWNALSQIISQFLTSFWQSGGLQGSSVSSSFYIICDASNNDPLSIQQGIVNIEVGVALQRPAEFVVIKLGQWAGGSNVQVLG
jgi:phage tail sheath protein FI